MARQLRGDALERVSEVCWRIPSDYKSGMRVDGLIYADDRLMADIRDDPAVDQVANVACLPGIQRASLAMPDIHRGYGFCIGGVCATDPEEGGVISPGGVGYDINCGVRMLRSNLVWTEVQPHVSRLVDTLYRDVPAGVGRTGKYHFNPTELRQLLGAGVAWLRDRELATDADLEYAEAGGCLSDAQPEWVSERAIGRGARQCGTLGSGNHFLEVQVVDQVCDPVAAEIMGLRKDMICVMIHSGSRGLGYQVCDDALKDLRGVPDSYGIALPDRQLACAPVHSPPGRRYLGAMCAAANYAWCNRQLLTCQVRDSFATVFGRSWEQLGMSLVYDVAHNIAKLEEHRVDDRVRQLWVHRKGATRAYPAHHPELPAAYRELGQPVLIPGDMGRASWVLVGQSGSMEQTFGTCCHGAGRRLSRRAAVKHAQGRRIDRELADQGVIARARSWRGLAEEQPAAYKDVDRVVDVVQRANLARKVARMRPVGVVKG